MINIYEILKKFDISVPAEKKEEFDKLMNYSIDDAIQSKRK